MLSFKSCKEKVNQRNMWNNWEEEENKADEAAEK